MTLGTKRSATLSDLFCYSNKDLRVDTTKTRNSGKTMKTCLASTSKNI